MNFFELIYRLVPGLDEEYPSSKSDSSDQEDDKSLDIEKKSNTTANLLVGPTTTTTILTTKASVLGTASTATTLSLSDNELEKRYDDVGSINSVGGPGSNSKYLAVNGCGVNELDGNAREITQTTNVQTAIPQTGCIERKRRKLPEIPKVRKRKCTKLIFFLLLFLDFNLFVYLLR